MYTNWWLNNPYTKEERGNITGIFPQILLQATSRCCGFCAEHNRTVIDFYSSGVGTRSKKTNEQQVKNHIEHHTELSFPIPGTADQAGYSGRYAFVPLVKSAGAAFIVVAEDSGTGAMNLVMSVIDLWPLFMSMLASVVVSGLLMWILVRSHYFLSSLQSTFLT